MLGGLNTEQLNAVLHTERPLLLLAGAGSGKTRVITVKIAYLIQKLGIRPEEIIAVTFTNKAAREMRERAIELEPQAERVLLKTFHSFCAWFLRKNAISLGLNPYFSIYDDDDSVDLLSSIYPERKKQLLQSYFRLISRAKDRAIPPEQSHNISDSFPDFPEVYARYEEKLAAIGNFDFGGLILKTKDILLNDNVIKSRTHARFKVILVDEYQDTNIAQFELIQALKASDAYLCVVGDDDQSIYAFRGAEIKNILRFTTSFENAEILKLTQNYRSSSPILRLADAVVSKNKERIGKEMFTIDKSENLPKFWVFDEQDEEIDAVLRYIDKKEHVAILYRTNAQSRIFETSFMRAGISYTIVGTLRFYEREEVKDCLALLRLLNNPLDEVSFRRIINKPARGLGEKSINHILSFAPHAKGNLIKSINYALEGLAKKQRSEAHEFSIKMDGLRTIITEANAESLSDFIHNAIEDFGLFRYYSELDEATGTSKIQNVEEFINAAAIFEPSFEGLSQFLEMTELDAQMHDESLSSPKVTLITMHNTKGLEYENVIITGMEDGIFPRFDNSEAELEEQRRLLYVAITRAKKELILTYTKQKRVFGFLDEFQPSRFLLEIPEDRYEIKSRRPFNLVKKQEEISTITKFDPGDEIRHEEYGRGMVIESAIIKGHERVVVQFEDGKKRILIPAFSPIIRI